MVNARCRPRWNRSAMPGSSTISVLLALLLLSLAMYRLYIDETGNADLKASQTDPNHRFLSLTGIIMHVDYTRTTLIPDWRR
jgi:hypothetical protein